MSERDMMSYDGWYCDGRSDLPMIALFAVCAIADVLIWMGALAGSAPCVAFAAIQVAVFVVLTARIATVAVFDM